MKFTEMMKSKEYKKIKKPLDSEELKELNEINEAKESPEDLLRKNKIKIKLIQDTAFGKQIDLFKMPDEKEIKEILKDFQIKLKGKSIFIVY